MQAPECDWTSQCSNWKVPVVGSRRAPSTATGAGRQEGLGGRTRFAKPSGVATVGYTCRGRDSGSILWDEQRVFERREGPQGSRERARGAVRTTRPPARSSSVRPCRDSSVVPPGGPTTKKGSQISPPLLSVIRPGPKSIRHIRRLWLRHGASRARHSELYHGGTRAQSVPMPRVLQAHGPTTNQVGGGRMGGGQSTRSYPPNPPPPGKYSKKGMGGGGVWDPKFCVPKMARPDFSNGKFRFFPRWSLWSGGHEQRILSSHVPPCHRHMVIAIWSGGGGELAQGLGGWLS